MVRVRHLVVTAVLPAAVSLVGCGGATAASSPQNARPEERPASVLRYRVAPGTRLRSEIRMALETERAPGISFLSVVESSVSEGDAAAPRFGDSSPPARRVVDRLTSFRVQLLGMPQSIDVARAGAEATRVMLEDGSLGGLTTPPGVGPQLAVALRWSAHALGCFGIQLPSTPIEAGSTFEHAYIPSRALGVEVGVTPVLRCRVRTVLRGSALVDCTADVALDHDASMPPTFETLHVRGVAALNLSAVIAREDGLCVHEDLSLHITPFDGESVTLRATHDTTREEPGSTSAAPPAELTPAPTFRLGGPRSGGNRAR